MTESKPPGGGEPTPDSSKQGNPPGAVPPPPPNPPAEIDDKYRCGSLQYTKMGLFSVFSWLLWGDLCFQLFESNGGPDILGLYLQDNYHVNNIIIALLLTTIPKIIGVVMTPIISFQSDRCRSRFGRRIPYMLFTAPFLCLFAVGIGYSDDIMTLCKLRLNADSWISPFMASMILIGFLIVGFSFFNEFVGTVYWYLFADVVPPRFMGRFSSLFQLFTRMAGFIANLTIAPYALTHMKAIHVGIAIIYFVGFGLMCWRVKEGRYPPVEDVKKGTPFADKVKLYFRECFTHPIYIMMYLSTAIVMTGNGIRLAGVFPLHLGQHQGRVTAHAGVASAVAMTPDGKRFVTGGQDGCVALWKWNAVDRKIEPDRPPFKGAGGGILSVAVTSDGKTAVSGTTKGLVEVWDMETGTCLNRLSGHEGDVRGIALSNDGSRIASAGADKIVRLWDLRNGTLLHALQGHEDAVNCVSFSSKGDKIASGGSDRKIILWDAATGARLAVLEESATDAEGKPAPGVTKAVYAVCFAPKLETIPSHEKKKTGIFNSGWLLVKWYFVQAFVNESLYDTPPDETSRVVGDDLWIVSGGRDGETDNFNALLRIWDISEGKLIQKLKGHKQTITSIVYKPEIRSVLSGSRDQSIRLWQPWDISKTATDQSFKSFSGYTRVVTGIACAGKGSMMVSVSDNHVTKGKSRDEVKQKNGTLHVWDIDQGISLKKGGISGSFWAIISMLLLFPLGMLLDHFNALRVTLLMSVISIPFLFFSYYWVHDFASRNLIDMFQMPFGILAGIAGLPVSIMLFPRGKYGQFCSANALVSQLVGSTFVLVGAYVMDVLTASSYDTDAYRYSFLIKGYISLLRLFPLFGIYYYWKKMGGEKYVPPET
ncbi:MAG: MFS transporter [Planctomycetota bacterium]